MSEANSYTDAQLNLLFARSAVSRNIVSSLDEVISPESYDQAIADGSDVNPNDTMGG